MRRLLPILLLLASACDSRKGSEEEAIQADPGNLMPDLNAQDPRQVRQRMETAFSGMLEEPIFSNVRPSPLGSICGYVDSKDKDGRYVGPKPFVVTPDGLALVSTSARIMFEDAEDIFPDFYIRWCASPEEMRRIAPLVAARDAADAALPAEAEPSLVAPDPLIPPLPEPPPVSAPPPKQETAKPPAAAPDRQPRNPDSFFDAVIRKKDDQKAQE